MRSLALRRPGVAFWIFLTVISAGLGSSPARAETDVVRVASQYGFGFLPMTVMEKDRLFEQQLAAAGLSGVAVKWATLGGGSAMNEAVLSGSLDIASSGVTPFLTLWGKTAGSGSNSVRAIGSLGSLPLWLNTRNPKVHSLKDFTDDDKIAVTAVKVSVHAILLQMAAAQLWGPDNYTRLDHLTVSLSQPDAMIALLSKSGDVDSHFTAPPFQYQEVEKQGIHRVISSEEILGGPASFVVAWTTDRFRKDNPKIYGAFVAALRKSLDEINADPKAAAAIYSATSRDSAPESDIVGMLKAPGTRFAIAPEGVMKYAEFMHRTGLIKTMPKAWTDLFFPEIHDQPGS